MAHYYSVCEYAVMTYSHLFYARVAELADAPDLGSGEEILEGSNPFTRSIPRKRNGVTPVGIARGLMAKEARRLQIGS